MKTPALTAAIALASAFLVAACAGSSGKPWTPPPAVTPGAETPAPVTAAPATPAPPSAAPTGVAPSAAPSADASVVPGEARVIELELTSALEIKQGGAKVTDLPVTPGETIRFVITNTAGYAHNFWIGTDEQLMANQTAGLPGIPDWTTGTQELEWTVPDDITGLKYGCTVTGHYMLMQGTFSPAQ